jgi:hypothetical protein
MIIAARLFEEAFHFDYAILRIDDRMTACGLIGNCPHSAQHRGSETVIEA